MKCDATFTYGIAEPINTTGAKPFAPKGRGGMASMAQAGAGMKGIGMSYADF